MTFLDDDDCWLPGHMGPQLAALRAHPRAAYAFGQAQLTTADLEPFADPFPAAPLPSGDVVAYLLRKAPQIGTVLFRREIVVSDGGFDPQLLWVEDGDLLVRLATRYPVAGVDSVGLAFRQRPASPNEAERRLESHRNYLARQRKWRAMRLPLPRMAALGADLSYRGMVAHHLSQDAGVAARRGQRGAAARILIQAVRISPAHALLRARSWWTTLGMIVARPASRPATTPRLAAR